MSVFHCGEKKLHPGELNNRERRIAINKLTSEISKMEREIQLKKDTGQKINELLSQQIEQTILKENSSAYTTPGGLRNWALLRKHVFIVENYCKVNYGGKLPPKHKLSDVLMHEPLKQAKSRKNPAKGLLENHGIVFPQAANTNKNCSDLVFRCSPATKEEEEEQLKMVLNQSMFESGRDAPEARASLSCFHGAYMPFTPEMAMVPPSGFYSINDQSHVNPSPQEGSFTHCTPQPPTQCFESSAGTDTCNSIIRTAAEPETPAEDEPARETARLLLSLNSFHNKDLQL